MYLLLERSPGGKTYPSDVFYLHSYFLEKTTKSSFHLGERNMTTLPIVETEVGDVSTYISTNVISIIDGQIFLSVNLFNARIRFIINVGIFVCKIGYVAQIKTMKQVVGKLKLELVQFVGLETFAQFASNLDKANYSQLERANDYVNYLNSLNQPF